jgi:hypothetical protein
MEDFAERFIIFEAFYSLKKSWIHKKAEECSQSFTKKKMEIGFPARTSKFQNSNSKFKSLEKFATRGSESYLKR